MNKRKCKLILFSYKQSYITITYSNSVIESVELTTTTVDER